MNMITKAMREAKAANRERAERDALAARVKELEEALRHVFYRNHKHSDSCDACLAAEILAKGGKS